MRERGPQSWESMLALSPFKGHYEAAGWLQNALASLSLHDLADACGGGTWRALSEEERLARRMERFRAPRSPVSSSALTEPAEIGD